MFDTVESSLPEAKGPARETKRQRNFPEGLFLGLPRRKPFRREIALAVVGSTVVAPGDEGNDGRVGDKSSATQVVAYDRPARIAASPEAGRLEAVFGETLVHAVELCNDSVLREVLDKSVASLNRFAGIKRRRIPGMNVHADFDMSPLGDSQHDRTCFGIVKDRLICEIRCCDFMPLTQVLELWQAPNVLEPQILSWPSGVPVPFLFGVDCHRVQSRPGLESQRWPSRIQMTGRRALRPRGLQSN